MSDIDDAAVARKAAKEKRILITFDLDFGEMYYFSTQKGFSAIVLRLGDQRVEAVNTALERFLKVHKSILRQRKKQLVILTETEARIIV